MCGHKLLVSKRWVKDSSMLSQVSWERLSQISKALNVSFLKIGYKLEINFYSQNLVIFHQDKCIIGHTSQRYLKLPTIHRGLVLQN